MKKWYLVVVKFTRRIDEDTTKAVSEQYLIDAVNFTDAETQITVYMEKLIKSKECIGSFEVDKIGKKEYRKIYDHDTGLSWYESKIIHSVYDEEKERAETTSCTYLVEEDCIDAATQSIHDYMKEEGDDYEMDLIKSTKIVSVLYPEKVA